MNEDKPACIEVAHSLKLVSQTRHQENQVKEKKNERFKLELIVHRLRKRLEASLVLFLFAFSAVLSI